MRCPKCGGNKSSVVDSRQAEMGIQSAAAVSVKNVSIVSRPTSASKREP